MEAKGKFRHELKYICSQAQLLMLEERIRPIMELDPHVGEKGFYTIRSLYYDDYADSAFWEKEDGTDPREKFRFRYYDRNTDLIHLEIKKKVRGKIQKVSCRVSQEECEGCGRPEWYPEPGERSVLNRLGILKRTVQLAPRVIVEYDRTPYIYPVGNVRVTFDRHIRSSEDVARFLDADVRMRPIQETGQHLLEVKFDELLPDYLYQALQLENLTQTAFSKYCLCRQYGV